MREHSPDVFLGLSLDKKWLKKRLIRKYRKQRAKHGFSDYDCFNLNDYLLQLIPAALERLASFKNSYPVYLWMYETQEEKHDVTFEEYQADLNKVASEIRRADRLLEHLGSDDIKEWEAEEQEGMRIILQCFAWIGHNITTLWD